MFDVFIILDMVGFVVGYVVLNLRWPNVTVLVPFGMRYYFNYQVDWVCLYFCRLDDILR